jgi:hypothetical protein
MATKKINFDVFLFEKFDKDCFILIFSKKID